MLFILDSEDPSKFNTLTFCYLEWYFILAM